MGARALVRSREEVLHTPCVGSQPTTHTLRPMPLALVPSDDIWIVEGEDRCACGLRGADVVEHCPRARRVDADAGGSALPQVLGVVDLVAGKQCQRRRVTTGTGTGAM